MGRKGNIEDIVITVPDEILEDIQEELGEEYWPFRIIVDSDHAGFIEFGTTGDGIGLKRGSRNGDKKTNRGPSEFNKKIEEWLIKRGAPDPKALVFPIMHGIIKNGIPPQPFIRPAIHQVEEDIKNGWYEDATMIDIAEDILFLMSDFLHRNGTVYDGGSIIDSLSYESIDPKTVNEDDPMFGVPRVGDEIVQDHIWKSDELDWAGEPGRAITPNTRRDLRF